MARAAMTIGLLDHMGGGNLGDDATQTAVIHGIKKRWPSSVILGFSMNPSDTQTRHGIPSFPIRVETWDPSWSPQLSPTITNKGLAGGLRAIAGRHAGLFWLIRVIRTVILQVPRAVLREIPFLIRSSKAVRRLDILIINGGGQLLDSWGGPWKFPYTILKWVLLAKFWGAKCYFLNVGAGPLGHPVSKVFVRVALFLSDYASVRDEGSQRLLRDIGFRRSRPEVFPDSVYSLNVPMVNAGSNRIPQTVGLSPMAFCDPRRYYVKDKSVYDGLIQNLAMFGSSLGGNFQLKLFSTDISFDLQALEDLHRALEVARQADSSRVEMASIQKTATLLSEMSSMDYLVTCRFHGVIFAHLLNIPVLAISHHAKVATLMNNLGLGQYCLDIHTCDSKLLMQTFETLVRDRDEIKRSMRASHTRYRSALAGQFDTLFPEKCA